MATTLRQQIIERIKNRLETILTSGGYETDVEDVFIVAQEAPRPSHAPVIEIREGAPDVRKWLLQLVVETRMTLELRGHVREGEEADRRAAAEDLLGDILDVVENNSSWNNGSVDLAVGTDVVQADVRFDVAEVPAAAVVVIEVLFRTVDGDPFTRGTLP